MSGTKRIALLVVGASVITAFAAGFNPTSYMNYLVSSCTTALQVRTALDVPVKMDVTTVSNIAAAAIPRDSGSGTNLWIQNSLTVGGGSSGSIQVDGKTIYGNGSFIGDGRFTTNVFSGGCYYGNTDPTFTPPVPCAIYVNTNNGSQFQWFANSWH